MRHETGWIIYCRSFTVRVRYTGALDIEYSFLLPPLVSPLKLLHTNDLLPSRIDCRDDACSCHASATFQMNDIGYQPIMFQQCSDVRMLTLE